MTDTVELNVDSLKKALAEYFRSRTDRIYVAGRRQFTGPELAKEIENETEYGKMIIKIAVKGTLYDLERKGVWGYTTP
jgi:hypothetical protein